MAAIATGEMVLAKFHPQETLNFDIGQSPACFAKSDLLPFELKKDTTCYFRQEEFSHSVRINSQGFRGKELEKEKPAETLRILTVGDSFTFGHGVSDEQTYSAVLENILRDQGENVEIINGGYASGFSPDSYYLFLKEKGLALKPDLVVMGFFVWNDISDLAETQWVDVDTGGLPKRIESRLRTVDNFGHLQFVKPRKRFQIPILRNSHLFQLIYSYKSSFFDRLITGFDKNSNFDPEKEATSIYDECIFIESCFPKYENEWQKVRKVIGATGDLLNKNGTKFLVLIIPTKEQAAESLCCGWEKLTEGETTGVNKKLEEFLTSKNIAFIDLLDKFKDVDSSKLYFDYDAHWKTAGHDLAAHIIADFLKEKPDYRNLFSKTNP